MHRSPTPYRCTVYSQHHCDGWPTSRPLAAQRRRRRALPSTRPFTWLLMRNWDHNVSRMTKVGYGNLTVNDGRQWEESGVSEKNAWHHCCRPMTHYQWWQVRQSLSPHGVIKHISGQTGVSLYGSLAATKGRHGHVVLHGRPSSSFDCQWCRSTEVTGSSAAAYFGGWTKILYFMTRV